MMEHPMHLHGVFMELQNGQERAYAPRKHTINVPPSETVEAHLTFEAAGPWALHCHLLFHMMTGMFARVEVSDRVAETEPPR
jgi:FtsP/CotA-like multicopper oxidase with cupredoxin domain